MGKKFFGLALSALLFALISVGVLLLALSYSASAQQPAGIHRIGILSPSSGSVFPARVEAFRQRLRQLGYVEGKNIFIEYRYAEGKPERLPDLAAELVRLKVDIIVTVSPSTTLAAKKASGTIPIVFASANDPVGTGLVSSLARPGGNITGLSLKGCPGGLPLGGIGWPEGKPGPHRNGGCGQGVGTQTSIASSAKP